MINVLIQRESDISPTLKYSADGRCLNNMTAYMDRAGHGMLTDTIDIFWYFSNASVNVKKSNSFGHKVIHT